MEIMSAITVSKIDGMVKISKQIEIRMDYFLTIVCKLNKYIINNCLHSFALIHGYKSFSLLYHVTPNVDMFIS